MSSLSGRRNQPLKSTLTRACLVYYAAAALLLDSPRQRRRLGRIGGVDVDERAAIDEEWAVAALEHQVADLLVAVGLGLEDQVTHEGSGDVCAGQGHAACRQLRLVLGARRGGLLRL